MTRSAALPALLLTACLFGTGPAAADALPGAVQWLIDRSGDPDRIGRDIGPYPLDGSGIVALDPLTGFATRPAPTPAAPDARFYAVLAREDGYAYAAAMALVTADGLPACGESLGVVGVDTGLAAIVTRSGLEAMSLYYDSLQAQGSDPYTALEPQLPLETFASFVTLPDGTRVAVSSSGYGDGGYQFFRLGDAQGQTVAFYLDFLGDRKGEWIDPPPCANV